MAGVKIALEAQRQVIAVETSARLAAEREAAEILLAAQRERAAHAEAEIGEAEMEDLVRTFHGGVLPFAFLLFWHS